MDNNENIIPSNEYEVRLEKLKQLQAQNVETFAYKGATLDFSKIIEDFDQLIADKSEVTFSGRLMSKRLHGGSLFADLVYNGQKIQIYFKQDEIGASLYQNFVDLYDVADFVEITGTPFITKRGEKTIVVKTYKLLTKTLLPLPEKWHGLKDIEIRFRKRYLDLLSNEETRKIFITRSKVIEFIRSYMIKHDFLEVETPILQTIASGAIAKPFKTHHNALDTDMFLRIAPELYLKELLVGGFERVFEIARCFRNEGLDTSHNPEFNQIEFYWAYKDYTFLIDFMEKFFNDLVLTIHNSQKLTYAGQEIDFTPTYPRLDFRQALIDYAGIDLDEHDTASLLETAKKKGCS
jgi:lysyl-tRNA synthetase class 2